MGIEGEVATAYAGLGPDDEMIWVHEEDEE